MSVGAVRDTPSGVRPAVAEPFFFESGDRPVYGVYHPPARSRPGAPVVVHCHTLGVEQLTSCRTEALSARAAATRGLPAFRYHSRGHADSGGDFADVTLESLVEDALAAAAQARDRSGAQRVIWLGVRFGALVAAHAAVREGNAAGLALWEPMNRPADYFRKMLRGVLFSDVAKGRKPDKTVDQMLEQIESEGKVDVHGYYLHQAIVRSSRDASLEECLAGWKAPALIVQVQERRSLAPSHAAVAELLKAQGAEVTVQQVHEEPAWHFVSNPAWEGAEVVRHTAEWLDVVA